MSNANVIHVTDNPYTNARLWRITGYQGRSDYDGPSDNNIDFVVVMDKRIKKDMIVQMFLNYYGKTAPVVVIGAEDVTDKYVTDK